MKNEIKFNMDYVYKQHIYIKPSGEQITTWVKPTDNLPIRMKYKHIASITLKTLILTFKTEARF